ncbi:PaaI family thioesterase [Thermoflexus sp.]|uniref:PaaI family thioesterase n=1 Tax=Thermoflexus sp. TaxID=1969742 RepID=UPI0017794AEB|nr:PaaI family thioesterase [Thermoflexus sp.]
MEGTLQPNSRMCFICGVQNPAGLKVRFYEDGKTTVRAEVVIPEVYQGYPGVAHGGVVAALLDEAAGRAVMIEAPERFMVTAQLTVRYHHPVPIGQTLLLVARPLRAGTRLARARAELRRPDGTLCAEAEAILVNVPPEIRSTFDAERPFWRVYPEEER